MNNISFLLRLILNENIINFLLKFFNKIYLKGEYKNWNEALKKCKKGYNSNNVLKSIKKNFLFSKKNKLYYERDGVLLKKNFAKNKDSVIDYCKILSKKNIIPNILDIGGGAGSIYFKNYNYLKKKKIKWVIFEQTKLVEFLKKNYKSKYLKFTSIIKPAYKNSFNIIILQSSLQYFEKPYHLLNKIIELNPLYIIIDETPIISSKEKIKIQVIPKAIYSASYPLYILNKDKIINHFSNKFFLEDERYCLTGLGQYNYKCLIFKRR